MSENELHSNSEVVATSGDAVVAHTTEGGEKTESHGHTLYAEPLFHVADFPVTNSMVNSWIVVAIIIVGVAVMFRRIKEVPTGIQNGFEMVIEAFLGIFDSVTNSRNISLKFFPFVFSFFIFILINNWLGILPGVGTIGGVSTEGGEHVFVPFFRGGTADLNTTLALAIIGVVASHIFGIMAIGVWKHLNKFINIKVLLEIPKKIKEDPSVIIVNPIKVFVGLIEIVSEIAKVISLSFRLFGNVYAGEVLLASMAAIFAFALPIPFMFMEVIIGLIQALIFSILILAYLTMATSKEEH